jgi:predicted Rdx family selenoprotein
VSLDNFKAVFFNDGIGQNFSRDALQVFLGFFAAPAIQIEHKKLSLPDVFHFRVAQPGERVLNCLPLRIKHGALRRNPDMCFHSAIITSAIPVQVGRCSSGTALACSWFVEGMIKTHGDDTNKFFLAQPHTGGIFIFRVQVSVKHRGIVGRKDDGNAMAQ